MCDDYDVGSYEWDCSASFDDGYIIGSSPYFSPADQKERDRIRAENMTTMLITNELAYRLRSIEKAETLEKKLELLESMLRYICTQKSYIRRHTGFRRTMRAKCKELVDDPMAAPIRETIVETIAFLKKV